MRARRDSRLTWRSGAGLKLVVVPFVDELTWADLRAGGFWVAFVFGSGTRSAENLGKLSMVTAEPRR